MKRKCQGRGGLCKGERAETCLVSGSDSGKQSSGEGRYKAALTFLIVFQGIFISRIAEGGAAHRDGILHVGDRVISVSAGMQGRAGRSGGGLTRCSWDSRHKCSSLPFLRQEMFSCLWSWILRVFFSSPWSSLRVLNIAGCLPVF